LFAGNVRANLDRGAHTSDAKLTEALQAVGLNLGLDHRIEEGGRNLSIGERQLLCLARILLAGKRFIIMDEPTASVDSETDAKIQNLLAGAFSGKTVITIAHRLDTLRRYDRIIEIENGRLKREGPATAFFQEVQKCPR
jgi:ABC-type multidrug transport system fused ATPase/permease subunit